MKVLKEGAERLYYVSPTRPFDILDATYWRTAKGAHTSLVVAQHEQCKYKIAWYTNKLEHTQKRNRKELRKKISKLTKRKDALKNNCPEEFV